MFALWEERNSKVHDTDRIKDLEGRPQLVAAIHTEWAIGASILPASDFAYLFRIKKQDILGKSIDFMKSWLAIIRQGRELYKDPKLPVDDFSHTGALRSWLGLPKPL